ncbi:hypothetical protein B7494_g3483 [Chlorociboria aeruginascens]|nr:hypothetical protein B7494_g3483 [Chlorociboria aeruginascens]
MAVDDEATEMGQGLKSLSPVLAASIDEYDSGHDGHDSVRIDEAKLLRKIDVRVLPMLFIIYVAAFLDRVNISNALTMGMPDDLGMTGQQPNVALTIFFIPYILMEIPSNIMMKNLNPHVWLSICIFLFGIIALAQGFVKSYGGLIATRFFLGLTEAGIFPGSFYLISFWYKHDEAQKRFTIYISSVILASAFGGLLASGIANMDGVRGLANWRWLFILEGIATICVGFVSFFLVTDFPQEATWLTAEEKKLVIARTKADEAHTITITSSDLVTFFSDPKNYLGAMMYFCILITVYAFAYFTPTIIKTFGYSVVQTQLHSVPPWASAFGLCIIMAYYSDKTGLRLPFVLFGNVILIAGLIILRVTHHNFSVQYAGICLTVMGAMGAQSVAVCWYLMNLRGHKQRAMGSGFMIAFGNTGGIIAPFAFLSKFAPDYKTGYAICLAMAALGTVSAGVYALLVVRERSTKHGNDDPDNNEKYLSL